MAAPVAAVDTPSHDDPAVVVRVEATFASVGRRASSCPDLRLLFRGQVSGLLPKEARAELAAAEKEFDARILEVSQLRQGTDAARQKARLAVLRVLRLVEESSAKLVADYQTGSYLSALWHAAELKYKAGRAERETLDALIEYYWWLWDQTASEEALRAAAASYYRLVGTVFPALSDAGRADALSFFTQRMSCLVERRSRVFCTLARDRREFWKNVNDRAWSALVGDAAWAAVDDLRPECGGEPVVTGAAPDPVAELAGAFLSSLLLEEEYAWLAPETTTNLDILSILVEREEDGLANSELHLLLDRAFEAGIGRDEAALLADQPLGETARVGIFAMRTLRAELVLERKLLALEAAHRRQVSVVLGLVDTVAAAWRQGAVTAGGLATADAMKGAEPGLKVLALLAITHKLLGDSLSVTITTPVQDVLTEVAFKPAVGLFGGTVKTSVEKAWEQHLEQVAEIKRQMALLGALRQEITSTAAAKPYLEALVRGDPMASPLGRRAPTTLRALLEDSDFIQATNGGLPWLLEPFCELSSQRNALLLRAAAFELEANARRAAVRVAAMRGLPVENPELKLTHASFEEIFKPGRPPPALVGASDQLISNMPVLGGLWTVYNLPTAVTQTIDYLYGNIQKQDDYLAALVRQQQSLMMVVNALETVGFDYGRMKARWLDIHESDHLALLNGSSEYANAYRRIRDHELEFEKRLVVSRQRELNRRALTPAGQTQLTAVQSRQDLESADLAVRAASAKLAGFALTGDYGAAAQQTRALEGLEAQRRRLLGIKPETVDLSQVAHAFEAEAVRRELVVVYTGLYQSTVREMVLSLASDAIADSIVANLSGWVGKRFPRDAGGVDLAGKLYGKLNPWAGVFSEQGVFNTFQSGLEGAAKSTAAQVLAGLDHQFTEGEIEGALDFVYDVVKEVSQNIRERPLVGAPEQVLDRASDVALEEALSRRIAELETFQMAEIEPLLRRLGQIGDDPDFDFQREQIVRQIAERVAAPGQVALRAEIAALLAGAGDSFERRLAAENELVESAARIAIGVAELEARNRFRDAEEGSDPRRAAARAAAAADVLSRLRSESVAVEDLRRLVDANDPTGLSRRLLGAELDIDTVRSALRRARKNQPERAGEIDAIADQVDARRIEMVQGLIDDFMAASGLGNQVVAIVQGGAAKGNPEYQGLFGDIDFTVFVAPGANDNEIKQQILNFFRERAFPLATQEERSPMDTETFVQPAGRLDAADTPFGTLILDAAVKRKDATRFYSEGGGKWAMNNYAFSGKGLWGDVGEIRRWTRAEPREGYGLALDMARHLGFLSDPRSTPDSLARMTPEQRLRQLDGVLKDSKYFLRLVDAYVMGHDGLGNSLYNNRMQWRQDSGPDASYHAQIAKDVEALVTAGSGAQRQRLQAVAGGLEGEALRAATRSVFSAEDLPMVRLLAGMKQKGDNPDPWAVVGGDTPETRAANAAALAAWMQDMAPRILAETAAVWQREHERAVASGDEDAIRAVRTDAHRIATTVGAADIYDSVGAKAMLQPPVRVREVTDESGRTRLVEQRLSTEEHLADLRRGIEADRQRRQRLADEIETRQQELRRRYPPDRELSEADRAGLEIGMRAIYEGVLGRAELQDVDNPAPWLMFWMRR
ncbi:MAG: hypothetical protein EA400_15585 [Chromatiaceae bacterium]|nr:MAG: hypothetical protein EA400_15585 [Chromatiaceae bacterium]